MFIILVYLYERNAKVNISVRICKFKRFAFGLFLSLFVPGNKTI